MTNTFKSGLVQLGSWLRGEISGEGPENADLLAAAEAQNRWFVPEFVTLAMNANGEMLKEEALEQWMCAYPQLASGREMRRVGLILAGNLPMVGWHDVLCVLISGHHAVIKCSSNDQLLIPAALQALETFCGESIAERISFVTGTLSEVDAVIATGSGNSNRYFDYYFREVPKVLRSQRTSVAVLTGNESESDLRSLGNDVFQYYGLGCRNVTKLFLPRSFDLDRLFGVWVDWGRVAQNNKYANNYDYHKAVWLLNQHPLVENGFLLLKEDTQWVSPVGTLFYEFYDAIDSVRDRIHASATELQCLVTEDSDVLGIDSVPVVHYGQTQCPAAWDYADGVDTMSFLLELSSSPIAN
jgi:hypothetical protein